MSNYDWKDADHCDDDAPVGNIHDHEEMEYWITTNAGDPNVIGIGYTGGHQRRLLAWIQAGGRYDLLTPHGNGDWAAVRFVDARSRASSIALSFPRPHRKRGFILIEETRLLSCLEIFELAKERGSKCARSHFYCLGCALLGLKTVVYYHSGKKAEPDDNALAAFGRHWRQLGIVQTKLPGEGTVVRVEFPKKSAESDAVTTLPSDVP